MKLYYATGACSLSPHILLREIGHDVELVKVNLKDHKTESGEDYYGINPAGAVPLLELDNGERLSQGVAIGQYLGDLDPSKTLIPQVGSLERYRVVELQCIAADVHRYFSPLFHPEAMTEAGINESTEKLVKIYTRMNEKLKDNSYLTGDNFTVADAYLFVTLRWAYALKVPISNLENLKAYFDRVKNRPAVQAALAAEGLK